MIADDIGEYTHRAAQYAEDVLDGKIVAGEFVRLACERFAADLEREDLILTSDGDRWCSFLETLPHVKGRWASKKEKFVLSSWQIFVTVNMYGWKKVADGLRRFREAYIEVARKNGKSFWVAGIGLGHLCIDDEYGAEIYCGATSEKQAWEVFRPAKLICERFTKLRTRFGLEVNAKTLNRLRRGDRFEPVIGKPGDGASPSCAIVDEFHEHRDADQVDTFQTGMGAREQPMLIHITTAGADMGGPCYAKRNDVISILRGGVEDDTIFGIVYTIDEEDQWDTEAALAKANPNLGISVTTDYLMAQMNQARRSATKQVAFKTKHLNCWVGAKAAWMNMLAYQKCKRDDLDLDSFIGRRCFGALDLASKTDIACLALLFPPQDGRKAAAFLRHYLPEDQILEGGNTRYKGWHQGGFIHATPGNVLDYSYIEDDLDELKSKFQFIEIPYDPFQATQFAVRAMARGYPMIEYGATVKNFSEPMKELEAMILREDIEFENDPVLTWMFGNVVARLDKKDNIFPDKDRPENKIDGVVALIMALARMIAPREDAWLYNDRGVLSV